jgi:hypothetical protein
MLSKLWLQSWKAIKAVAAMATGIALIAGYFIGLPFLVISYPSLAKVLLCLWVGFAIVVTIWESFRDRSRSKHNKT